jgi:hypothetical protein
MKLPIPASRTTVSLLGLCGFVALIILAEAALLDPGAMSVNATGGDTSLVLPESPDAMFTPGPLSDFSQILERPLLFADRRMPPPEVAAVQAKARTPLRLKLEGVAISSESRVALLRNTANNQLLQLAEGMSHDGWALEEISAVAASFRRGEEVSELLLDTRAN